MPERATTESLRDFERSLAERLDPVSAPAVAYGIAIGHKTLLLGAKGLADKERALEATPRTPFAIASVTKPLTGVAIAILAERGRIDLDVPINTYLGEDRVVAKVGEVERATVRRVANHSSGLPLHYQFFYEDEPYSPPPMSESIRRYGKFFSAPGSRYLYANFGYGLLGHLIACVSGRSYEEFMAEEVFAPIGMRKASIAAAGGEALSYGDDGVAYPRYRLDTPGASSAFASAEDLLAFGQASLGFGTSLLSASMRQEIFRATVSTGPNSGYGLGWASNRSRFGLCILEHMGGMGGVSTILRLVPELDLAIVVLANGVSSLPLRAADEVLAMLAPSPQTEPTVSAKQDTALPIPSTFQKHWKGNVETHCGMVPCELDFSKGYSPVATIAGVSGPIQNLDYTDGRIQGLCDGDLGTEDAGRRAYRIQLDLTVDKGRLFGAATALSTFEGNGTGAPGNRRGNAMSYWTSLGS